MSADPTAEEGFWEARFETENYLLDSNVWNERIPSLSNASQTPSSFLHFLQKLLLRKGNKVDNN